MDNHYEQRSNEKQSASSSEGRRKKRPSLIPLRNSATRKSEFSEKNHSSDRMNLTAEEPNETYEPRESGGANNWSVKSENELHLRTPSEHHSVYSSPRTPRSSPKDFESDTPFVPFVHQSLTRTVWESEEIIPEEKEDIERKESQTQFNNQHHTSELEARTCIMEDQGAEKGSQASMESLNSNLYTFNFTKSPPKIIEEYISKTGDNPEENEANLFKKEFEISHPLVTTILPPIDNNNEIKFNVPIQNEKESFVMEVTHEEYVSKAPIYYQQEMIASAKKSERKGINEYEMNDGKRNWEKFSFSYLESISIRPVIDERRNEVISKNNNAEKYQSFKIANPIFEHVKSSKKHNVSNETNFHERLLTISKGYEEKIGFEREIVVHSSITSTADKEIQTEQEKDTKNNLEVESKDELMSKEEVKDLGEKKYDNELEIGKDTKGENEDKENEKNQQIIEEEIKVLKTFACQYDQNDIGIKPSIKRVSIASAKNNVIFDIDSNNSTITCEMNDKKNKNKKKEKKETKSKPKDKVEQTKIKKEEAKAESLPIEEKTRKSKRNLSRNEAKKARA